MVRKQEMKKDLLLHLETLLQQIKIQKISEAMDMLGL